MSDGRYCAYLRKSRADAVREQLEDGYDALAHHRRTLEGLAARMGAPILEWYEDGIKSGDSIEQRPEMRRLLSDVEAGEWDGVLCMEVERLTRGSMIDQGTVGDAFSRSGTLIVTPLKVYDPASEADMEYFEFGMFMSRREYKTIKKRLLQGRRAACLDGQFIGSIPPYGYDKAVVDGKHTLVPNANARFVRIAFEEYAKGSSYRRIADVLDAAGAPTARGGKWNPNSIRNMVCNKAYIGRIVWGATRQTPYRENGRTRYRTENMADCIDAEGLHPAIIDAELWEKAQARTAAAPVRKGYEPRNMFGRILVCAECGKALHWQGASHPNGADMYSHRHKGEGCMTKGCSAKKLETLFAKALANAANDIEVASKSPSGAVKADFERSIAEAQSAIEANFDRMERGIITEDDFVRRRKVLEKRIADAQEMMDSLPEDDGARTIRLKECLLALADDGIPVDEKRRFIWAIVDRIEYRNRATSWHDDIHLDIYLRKPTA